MEKKAKGLGMERERETRTDRRDKQKDRREKLMDGRERID